LSILEPFGKGNTKPLFAQKNIRVLNGAVFGKNRNVAKMKLADGAGTVMDAVYFGEAETFLAYAVEKGQISITYYPEINSFHGRETLQLTIRNYC
jgi:single-stranded-DNA-specific exonuclease